MRARLAEEYALLRESFPGAVHQEQSGNDWFLLPAYRCPPSWRENGQPIDTVRLAFMVNSSYPGQQPYAFLVPRTLTFSGATPNNFAEVPDGHCPFEGGWAQFSWSPNFPWEPGAEVRSGVNLLHWSRSFGERLKEGV